MGMPNKHETGAKTLASVRMKLSFEGLRIRRQAPYAHDTAAAGKAMLSVVHVMQISAKMTPRLLGRQCCACCGSLSKMNRMIDFMLMESSQYDPMLDLMPEKTCHRAAPVGLAQWSARMILRSHTSWSLG